MSEIKRLLTYLLTQFWAGPIIDSQKLVGSGPVQPVRWLYITIPPPDIELL